MYQIDNAPRVYQIIANQLFYANSIYIFASFFEDFDLLDYLDKKPTISDFLSAFQSHFISQYKSCPLHLLFPIEWTANESFKAYSEMTFKFLNTFETYELDLPTQFFIGRMNEEFSKTDYSIVEDLEILNDLTSYSSFTTSSLSIVPYAVEDLITLLLNNPCSLFLYDKAIDDVSKLYHRNQIDKTIDFLSDGLPEVVDSKETLVFTVLPIVKNYFTMQAVTNKLLPNENWEMLKMKSLSFSKMILKMEEK